MGELSTLTRDLLLRKTAPEGGAALLSGGFDSATLDQLGKDVPSNRFLYLASTLQKAAADLYYSADRRTDAELCLLRLCDESLCGDPTALENRITRLEDAAARGAVISAAASKPVEPPPAEAPPPWDEPPLPEEPPMREEPGERVFDIPEDAIPVRPAQPKAVPVKPAASIPSAPKPQTAIHSAAPVSGDWWKALSENCKGQIPPMYRAFLDLCGGVLEGDQLTVFAPDEITLNRLDNDRVRGVLSAEAEKVSGQPVRLLLREGEPPKPSPEENRKQLLQFDSARRGFTNGKISGAARQAELQQKIAAMQEKMTEAQDAVEAQEFTASVGGGVVEAKVNGKKEVLSVTIKPEAVDPEDVEMLQDLVVSAVNEALRQANDAMENSMNGVTGGLDLSSFGL